MPILTPSYTIRPELTCLMTTRSNVCLLRSVTPFNLALGTQWCPLEALSAIGVIHGVKGSPRCPKISVQAHGAWAYIRGTPWGPAHARREQGGLWRSAVVHANHIVTHSGAQEVITNDSINRAARVIVQTADARFVDPQSEPAPGTEPSLYVIIRMGSQVR